MSTLARKLHVCETACLQSTPGADPAEDPSELLSNKTYSNVMTEVEPAINEVFSQSALDVLKNLDFWVLALVVFVVLGSLCPCLSFAS